MSDDEAAAIRTEIAAAALDDSEYVGPTESRIAIVGLLPALRQILQRLEKLDPGIVPYRGGDLLYWEFELERVPEVELDITVHGPKVILRLAG